MTTQALSTTATIRPFKIEVAAATLDRIRDRVRAFRWDAWSEPSDAGDWRYGPLVAFLRGLCEYWGEHYGWRQHEAAMNAWPHFLTTLDDIDLHFVQMQPECSTMAEPLQSMLVSRTFSTPCQTTHYIECGPAGGPLMIFVHGWPEISLIWRAQMDAFAANGWHCIAPDMRGYGGSSASAANDAYTIEQIVVDMAELHDHLGGQPAIWVGHDWGSVVVGELAAHEPKRSRGVVLISVPYFPDANALPTLVPLVDRTIYPADQYPDGQWDYYRYYTTHFEAAVADLDADKASSLASIFRSGDPASIGKPSPNALVTCKGGRFGAEHRAPRTQPDPALWPPADFDVLVQSFQAHGFRAPCAWYLNDAANIAYARKAPHGGRLLQPVLFVNGDFDQINTIKENRSGDPMRAACPNLTVTSLPGAHWLPLECKAELVQAIRNWLLGKGL